MEDVSSHNSEYNKRTDSIYKNFDDDDDDQLACIFTELDILLVM